MRLLTCCGVYACFNVLLLLPYQSSIHSCNTNKHRRRPGAFNFNCPDGDVTIRNDLIYLPLLPPGSEQQHLLTASVIFHVVATSFMMFARATVIKRLVKRSPAV